MLHILLLSDVFEPACVYAFCLDVILPKVTCQKNILQKSIAPTVMRFGLSITRHNPNVDCEWQGQRSRSTGKTGAFHGHLVKVIDQMSQGQSLYKFRPWYFVLSSGLTSTSSCMNNQLYYDFNPLWWYVSCMRKVWYCVSRGHDIFMGTGWD